MQQIESSIPGGFDRQNCTRTFSRIGWAFFAMLALSQGGAVLLSYGIQYLAIRGSEAMIAFMQSEWFIWIISDLASYGFGLPVLLLILHSLPNAPAPARKRVTGKQFGGLALVSYAAVYIFNLLGMAIVALLSLLKGGEVGNILQNAVDSSNPWLTFLFGVVIAPVVEEFIFRGVLINKLRGYGESLCIFASGLLFGLFHGNLNQLFYAFVLGCIFAYVTLRTGSILWSILLHMTVNFVGLTLSSLVLAAGKMWLTALMGLAILGILAAGITIFVRHRRNIHLHYGCVPLTEGNKRRLFLCNSGVIAFSLLCLLLIIYVTFLV